MGAKSKASVTETKLSPPENGEREIFTHKVELVAGVRVFAADERGPGGANHLYVMDWAHGASDSEPLHGLVFKFQNGPVPEAGANGITNEALLAVVIDRLEGFQAGPFPCDENNNALAHARRALEYLLERTEKRIARGVEGKLER